MDSQQMKINKNLISKIYKIIILIIKINFKKLILYYQKLTAIFSHNTAIL